MKKKLSKHKVKLVKEEKAKRKEKNKKLNKNKKIISKRKFEINGGKGYKKYIEDTSSKTHMTKTYIMV